MSSNITYSSPVCSCIICKKQYSVKGIHSHYTATHSKTNKRPTNAGTGKFQVACSCITCRNTISVQNLARHKCTAIFEFCCGYCGKPSHTKFCSHSCSAIASNCARLNIPLADYIPSETIRSRKQMSKPGPFTKVSQCCVCNKWMPGSKRTCSAKCLSIRLQQAGQLSAAKLVKRSKQEIELFTLCESLPTAVTHNTPIVNGWDADIIFNDIKLAILWNGPWHYRQMPHKNHSLLQVQTRDAIKIKELTALGWEVLVFEDRYYTPATAFEVVKKRALDSNQDKH